ncbi:MAG: hypothetical protein Q3972_07900 [Corynebacterium sp.]|nr:hypothetical protein [Corynebacterium sp.]
MASKKLAAALCAISLLGAGIAAPSAHAATATVTTKNGHRVCSITYSDAEKNALSKAAFEIASPATNLVWKVSGMSGTYESWRQGTVADLQSKMPKQMLSGLTTEMGTIDLDSSSSNSDDFITLDEVISNLKSKGVYADSSKYDALRTRAADLGVTDTAYAVTLDFVYGVYESNLPSGVTMAQVIDVIDRDMVAAAANLYKALFQAARNGVAACLSGVGLSDSEKKEANAALTQMDQYISDLGPDRPKKPTGFFGSSFSS